MYPKEIPISASEVLISLGFSQLFASNETLRPSRHNGSDSDDRLGAATVAHSELLGGLGHYFDFPIFQLTNIFQGD